MNSFPLHTTDADKQNQKKPEPLHYLQKKNQTQDVLGIKKTVHKTTDVEGMMKIDTDFVDFEI